MTRSYLFLLLLSLPLSAFPVTWESALAKFNAEENPLTAAEILTDYAESTSDSNGKYNAYVRTAHLYHLLGYYEKAQICFERAFSALPDQPDFKMLLYSSVLLIETNQWERAENQLDVCLIRCRDEELLSATHFYFAYLAFLKGDSQTCSAHIQKIIDLNVRDSESRLDYYLPWIICFSEKHPDDFKKIISFLKTAGYTTAETEFDIRLLSPVMMLSENIDREIPSPQEEKTEKKTSQKQRLIVAGSYSKKENADAVLKDLEMQGFSGKIREISQNGKTFFRIYVLPIENDFTKTVSFLKQMEIDAFTVNDVY